MSQKGLLNQSQIAAGMDISRATVIQRLKMVAPVVKDTKGAWYKLSDIVGPLQREGKSAGSTEVDDLGPREEKEYWQAKREKVTYLERAASLIPVETYEKMLATIFKSLSTSLESIPDTLERRSDLSPKQIDTIIGILDGARTSMTQQLIADMEAEDELQD